MSEANRRAPALNVDESAGTDHIGLRHQRGRIGERAAHGSAAAQHMRATAGMAIVTAWRAITDTGTGAAVLDG